jgi:hypothetical protein
MRIQIAAVLAATAVLAGCGGTDDDPVARDPSPTTAAAAPAGRPHWPTQGCETRSGSSIDYAAGAKGEATPEAALASYVPDGASVVRQHARPHRAPRWLVVDADNQIVRAVEMFGDDGHGWLVTGVEECSG